MAVLGAQAADLHQTCTVRYVVRFFLHFPAAAQIKIRRRPSASSFARSASPVSLQVGMPRQIWPHLICLPSSAS